MFHPFPFYLWLHMTGPGVFFFPLQKLFLFQHLRWFRKMFIFGSIYLETCLHTALIAFGCSIRVSEGFLHKKNPPWWFTATLTVRKRSSKKTSTETRPVTSPFGLFDRKVYPPPLLFAVPSHNRQHVPAFVARILERWTMGVNPFRRQKVG